MLGHSCEPDEAAHLDVVISDESIIVGDFKALFPNGLPRPDGLHVATRKRRLDWGVERQELLHGLVTGLLAESVVFAGVSVNDEIGIEL